jgi:hypothetical protein
MAHLKNHRPHPCTCERVPQVFGNAWQIQKSTNIKLTFKMLTFQIDPSSLTIKSTKTWSMMFSWKKGKSRFQAEKNTIYHKRKHGTTRLVPLLRGHSNGDYP